MAYNGGTRTHAKYTRKDEGAARSVHAFQALPAAVPPSAASVLAVGSAHAARAGHSAGPSGLGHASCPPQSSVQEEMLRRIAGLVEVAEATAPAKRCG